MDSSLCDIHCIYDENIYSMFSFFGHVWACAVYERSRYCISQILGFLLIVGDRGAVFPAVSQQSGFTIIYELHEIDFIVRLVLAG